MTPPPSVTVAALRAFRAAHGLSLARLAELIGHRPSVVARYLAGREPARAGAILARLGELTDSPSMIAPAHRPRGRPPGSRNRAVTSSSIAVGNDPAAAPDLPAITPCQIRKMQR